MKFLKYFIFIFALLIIGFLSGSFYQMKTIPVSKKIIPSVAPTPENKAVNWKLYRSSVDDKLSFEYPTDWKIEVTSQSKNVEDITFTSPNGFSFEYMFTGIQGGPSQCVGKENCPKITNYSSKPVSVYNWKTIYMVQGLLHMDDTQNTGTSGTEYKEIYLSNIEKPDFAVVAGAGVGFNVWIPSKNVAGKYIIMTGHYPEGSYQQTLPYEEYFKLNDVEIASRIMQSLSY